MDLLPIIYLSLLITAILILTVITASFIASKLRNKGNNNDRILALAYNGSNISNNDSQGPKVIVQPKIKLTKSSIRKNDNHLLNDKQHLINSLPRVNRITSEKIPGNRGTSVDSRMRTYDSKERYSIQKQNNRLEVLNSANNAIPNSSVGGHDKNNFRNSDPLYFYSASNDHNYYTIKA